MSKDEFQTRIICVNSYTDVADKIRNIGELAHQSDVVGGYNKCSDTELHYNYRFGVLMLGMIAPGSVLILVRY